jgi:hypothetical protein
MSHLYKKYGIIDGVDLKKNHVMMMTPYDPETPLALLVDKRGPTFTNIGDRGLTDEMFISKGITLLSKNVG